MKIVEVKMFKLDYEPIFGGEIRRVCVYVVAENKEKAQEIAFAKAHKFFDQDLRLRVNEIFEGAKVVEK